MLKNYILFSYVSKTQKLLPTKWHKEKKKKRHPSLVLSQQWNCSEQQTRRRASILLVYSPASNIDYIRRLTFQGQSSYPHKSKEEFVIEQFSPVHQQESQPEFIRGGSVKSNWLSYIN